MLKSDRNHFKFSLVSKLLIPVFTFLLVFLLPADAIAMAGSDQTDQSDVRQAVLGTIVDLQEDAFIVKEIRIIAEGVNPDANPDDGRLISIAVTESTVFDRLNGLADLSSGDSVAVAGIRRGTGSEIALIADYIVPLTEMSLSVIEEADQDQADAFTTSAADEPIAHTRVKSTNPNNFKELNFQGNILTDRGGYSMGPGKLLSLGDLGNISIEIYLRRTVSVHYHHPARLYYQIPKLVVGEPAVMKFDLPTNETFNGTYSVKYHFIAKIKFSLTALGSTYHLIDHEAKDTLTLDTDQTKQVISSSVKRLQAFGKKFSFAVPKTDIAFKIAMEVDTSFQLNKPSIKEMISSSQATIKDSEGSSEKKERQFAATQWNITPTAEEGKISVPAVHAGPSLNQITVKLRTELTGPISIPAYMFGSHSFSLPEVPARSSKFDIPFTAAPELKIVTETLPGGLLGEDYESEINVSGGYEPYHFTIESGALPAGIHLDPVTGKIWGVPNKANTGEPFTVRMTDAAGYSKERTYQIPILHLEADGLIIGQTIHQPFTFELGVHGGTAPYQFQVMEGSLPPGLTLDTNTGVISGTPPEAGAYKLKFRVSDSTGQKIGGSNLSKTSDLTVLVVPVGAGGSYQWEPGEKLNLGEGPGNGMVYNSETGETMMFTSMGDTVVLRDGVWQKLEIDGPAPLPRNFAAMAYSPNLGGVVLYGGRKNDYTGTEHKRHFFADTWLWDGEKWTKLHDGVIWNCPADPDEPCELSGDDAPPERYQAAMSRDQDGNIILYGGHINFEPYYYGDTWVLKIADGEAKWFQVGTDNQPYQGQDPLLVYHEALGQPVLMANDLVNGDILAHGLWLWTGGDWTDLTNQAFQNGEGPMWQYNPGITYDRASKQILLYGGTHQTYYGDIMNELWALGTLSADGNVTIGSWRKLENSTGQPEFKQKNDVHTVRMAYDAAAGQVILYSEDFIGDTNLYTYSLSGLATSPSVLPADGIAKTKLSYTVVNQGGTPIEGRELILQGTGSVSGNLPVLSAVTGSSGSVTFETSHTVAEQVMFIVSEKDTGQPLGAGKVEFVKPVPDAAESSLELNKPTLLMDGSDTVQVTVSIRNVNDLALPGYRVKLTAPDSPTAVILPHNEVQTQADGTATFSVSNTVIGTFDIEARVLLDDETELLIDRANIEVVLPDPLLIRTTALPDGKLGEDYETILAADGGTAPYEWSVTEGFLPEGLTLDPQTGVISGTISASSIRGADTYVFTVQVEDHSADKQIVSKQLSILAAPEDFLFDTSEWPDGELKPGLEENNDFTVGDRLAIPLLATGGTAPYTWIITSGSLPPGVDLDEEAGIINGVPMEAGIFDFIATVIDASGNSKSAFLKMNVAARPMLYVQSGTSDDPDGTAQAASGDVTAVAYGQGTVTTAVFENNPAGDTEDVFRAAGRYFDVKAEPGHQFNQIIFTVGNLLPSEHTIYWWNPSPDKETWERVSNQSYNPMTQTTTVTIATYSSPNLQQMFGTEFAVGSELLPAPLVTGVSLADNGTEVEVLGANFTSDSVILFGDTWLETVYVSQSMLRGFLIPGNSTVEVRVLSPFGLSEVSGASLFTYPENSETVPKYWITLHAQDEGGTDLALVLPGQQVNLTGTVLNEQNLPVHGQIVQLHATQGNIEANDVITNENGVYQAVLTIPDQLLTTQVTVTASVYGDHAAASIQKTIQIYPGELQIVNDAELGALAKGEPYHLQFKASGGVLPYSWAIISGELPAGWSLSETGKLTGTPVHPGEYTFTVQVTDAGGSGGTPVSKPFKLTIHKVPPIESVQSLKDGKVGTHYHEVLSPPDNEGSYTWEVAEGELPAGLSLTKDGVIQGVPEEDGSFEFKVIAKNELGIETKLVTIHLYIEPKPEESGSEPETPEPEPEEPGSGTVTVPSPGSSQTTNEAASSDNSGKVIPAGGTGTFEYEEELTVFIPAGATDQDLRITIEKLSDALPLVGADDVLLSPVYEILKNVTGNFLKPITLTFRWDKERLGAGEIPAVFYYDEEEQEWIHLGGTFEENQISVNVDHFTKFAVFAIPKPQFTDIHFTDIGGHWAEADMKLAATRGIVSGYPDGTFRPENQVSRAEFAVMLARALQLEGEGEPAPLTFKDSADIQEWAIAPIHQMVQAGIISGYDDHTFRPNAIINRAEMAVMVARALELNLQAHTSTHFHDDRDIPVWAKGAVQAVNELAIVNGRGNQQFVPLDAAKRAEATVMLLRMIEFISN